MIRAEGLRLTALSLWSSGAEPTLLNPEAPFSFFFFFFPFSHKPILFKSGLLKRNSPSAIRDLNFSIRDQFKYGARKES